MARQEQQRQHTNDELVGLEFRRLATNLHEHIVLIDRQRRYLWANRITEGVSDQVLYRSKVDDFVSPNDLPSVIDAISRCFETGETTEYLITGDSGSTVQPHYETRVVRLEPRAGDQLAMLLTRNVTERVIAERQLRSVLESSPDYILTVDQAGRVLYVNHLDLNRAAEHVLGRKIDDFVPAASLETAYRVLKQVVDTGEAMHWEVAGDAVGVERLSVRVLPFDGPDGARALIVAQDISEMTRARRQLQASEMRMKLAMEDGRVGFWDMDIETKTGKMTPELSRTLGLADGEIAAPDLLARLHPNDAPRLRELLRRIADGEQTEFECEHRIRDAEGKYRRFVDRARRINEASDRPTVCGTMLDVTELRNAEQRESELRRQLAQAQRLESIGLLAGGIAHDFNNLLMVIMTGVSMCQVAVGSGEDVLVELAHIQEAAERAAELTRQLLAFGRRSPLRIDSVNLGEVIQQVLSMARRVISESIEIVYNKPAQPIVVRGDRAQLQQALLNLCINARDAMPDGGRLEISLDRVDERAVISIADNGTGIKEGDLDRIFDPFFTTKPTGVGTGLGLAMVHGIVEQHKGTISVKSDGESGTVFELRIPLGAAPAKHIASRKPGLLNAASGTILVAEDEPLVLGQVVRVLEAAGYRVIPTRDGEEAVSAFLDHRDDIDLVLLDVVMPKLDGWQTYERIRRAAPNVRALFSSGYAAGAVRGDVGDKVPLLSKPYQPDDLLQAVANALV